MLSSQSSYIGRSCLSLCCLANIMISIGEDIGLVSCGFVKQLRQLIYYNINVNIKTSMLYPQLHSKLKKNELFGTALWCILFMTKNIINVNAQTVYEYTVLF